MTPKAAIERTNETAELRAELAELRERLATIEALLSGLYGPSALGSSKPPPGKPPAEPTKTMRPIATIGPSFWGGTR